MERFGDALDAFLRFSLRADDWIACAVFILIFRRGRPGNRAIGRLLGGPRSRLIS